MRAEYVHNIANYLEQDKKTLVLSGEEAYHLIKVARVRAHEKILILDGMGLAVQAQVSAISKKELHLVLNSVEYKKRAYNLHLGLGVIKKPAFEEVLKLATEVGIRSITPIICENSIDYRLNSPERFQSIMVNALKQSNNPYLPVLNEKISFSQFNYDTFSKVFCFSLGPEIKYSAPHSGISSSENILLLVGPEGGFTEKEHLMMGLEERIKFLGLPTPILRTPTAVVAATSYLLADMKD